MAGSGLVPLLVSATATGAGTSMSLVGRTYKTFQAIVAGTGAVTATVDIEVSNNGEDWMTLGTITLSDTTRDDDGFASSESWSHHRANLTAVSGTGATVSVYASVSP